MQKFVAVGRLSSVETNFDIPVIHASMNLPEGQEVKAKIGLSNPFINVVCETSESVSIPSLRNAVQALADHIAATIGFISVTSPFAEIHTLIDLQNYASINFKNGENLFDDRIENNKSITFSFSGKNKSLDLYIILGDKFLQRAIYELRQAIRQFDFTAMHCRLAIESIRNSFFAPNLDLAPGTEATKTAEKAAWKNMATQLRVSREAGEIGKKAAFDQRHGRNLPQTWEQRKQVMKISWEIVWRYYLYLEMGSLPPEDFPVL